MPKPNNSVFITFFKNAQKEYSGKFDAINLRRLQYVETRSGRHAVVNVKAILNIFAK